MQHLVDIFKALGEDTRLKIVSMLFHNEMCVDDLIKSLELSQSAVSHHVKVLRQAGLLNIRRKGKWTFYSINKSGLDNLEESLQQWLMDMANTGNQTFAK